jgi:hypothetical protein
MRDVMAFRDKKIFAVKYLKQKRGIYVNILGPKYLARYFAIGYSATSLSTTALLRYPLQLLFKANLLLHFRLICFGCLELSLPLLPNLALNNFP